MTEASERRKEYRHVVVGLVALLDGMPAPILDISRTAVRLVKPHGFISGSEHDLVFVIAGAAGERPRAYRAVGMFVRSTGFDVVFRYAEPIRSWARVLRRADSFLQTALRPL